MKHPLTNMNDANTTKERIMLEASIMFAQRGYASVSMRDIAERVKVKHASIYSHFESKDALYDAILSNITEVYRTFYIRMDELIAKTESFGQVLDCLFSEVIDVYDMYIYYGFSLITTEQFRDEKSNEVFNEVLVKTGIDYSRAKFDECIRKGWVKSFDTEMLATLFHNSVVMGTLMRTHQDMGQKTAYDARTMFLSLKRFMLDSVDIIGQ